MIQKIEKKGHAMGVLLVVLLFLAFVLSALFTVLIGSRVYGDITVCSDLNYTSNTALNYVTNKVHQGDRTGFVGVVGMGGTSMLEMKQEIGGFEYMTWIYWGSGTIRELFTDTRSRLELEGGLEILGYGGLELKRSEPLLHIETLGERGGAISPSLGSGGLETGK